MKKLFQEIPYPWPGTDPVSLDLRTLPERVMNVDRNLRREDPTRDKLYGAALPGHQA